MSFLQDIYGYIKSGETDTENLGLEIEHFVVDKNGDQIGFDKITSLIEKVAHRINADIIYTDGYPVGYENENYSVSLEPSCQFEISIKPFHDIDEIEKTYREFLDLWEPEFAKIGYRIVTFGNLPKVEQGRIRPDDIPLSPKKRYQYMDAYFRQSGKYGKYMMRASASTQVSVDYRSERDLIKKLRVLQKISPILMLMMENKTDAGSTLPKHPSRCLLRALLPLLFPHFSPEFRCGLYALGQRRNGRERYAGKAKDRQARRLQQFVCFRAR